MTVKIKEFVRSEDVEQMQLVNWLLLKYPDVLFTCSMAGVRVSPGVARKMKKMGNRAGFPDLMLFSPKILPSREYYDKTVGREVVYHGLFIELKRTVGGVVSPIQKEVLRKLNERGYKAVVAKGMDEAVKVIEEYLGKK